MNLFQWDAVHGRAALDSFADAGAGTVRLSSADVSQGIMTSLVSAELYAAKLGFATPIPADGGQVGYVIGGAREAAKAFYRKDIRKGIWYLAAHGAARRASASTYPVPGQVSGLEDDFVPVGGVGMVVLAVSAGVLALMGAYWAGNHAGVVETSGQHLVSIKAIESNMAMSASGQITPQDALKANRAIALAAEENAADDAPIWPWIAGSMFLGGAAVLYFKR